MSEPLVMLREDDDEEPRELPPPSVPPPAAPRPAVSLRRSTTGLPVVPIVLGAAEVVAVVILAFVSWLGLLVGLIVALVVLLTAGGGVLLGRRIRRVGWRNAFRRGGARLLGAGRGRPFASSRSSMGRPSGTFGRIRAKLPRALGGTRPRSPFSPARRAQAWLGMGGPASRRGGLLASSKRRGGPLRLAGGGRPSAATIARPPARRLPSPGRASAVVPPSKRAAAATTAARATAVDREPPPQRGEATSGPPAHTEEQPRMTTSPQPSGGGRAPAPVVADDEQSFYRWGKSLPAWAAVLTEFRRPYDKLLVQARDHQPASPVLTEKIEQLVDHLRRAEALAEELGPTFESHHSGDVGRVETPRKGSAVVEARADVTTAYRDM